MKAKIYNNKTWNMIACMNCVMESEGKSLDVSQEPQ